MYLIECSTHFAHKPFSSFFFYTYSFPFVLQMSLLRGVVPWQITTWRNRGKSEQKFTVWHFPFVAPLLSPFFPLCRFCVHLVMFSLPAYFVVPLFPLSRSCAYYILLIYIYIYPLCTRSYIFL
uniref:Uncharacterized protein n=1 Tax=Trypanosoma congolense (strain IL3000) TaxID=1068625 RepID=G0UL95_TRYCI|nr:hypothetical protein, unlikely [Trypanosoma congolense IL3000]